MKRVKAGDHLRAVRAEQKAEQARDAAGSVIVHLGMLAGIHPEDIISGKVRASAVPDLIAHALHGAGVRVRSLERRVRVLAAVCGVLVALLAWAVLRG